MDSQSSVQVYGQVWHMVDPICGTKEEGSRPPLLSALVHNNRYGVVVQRTETITGNSILMVPCSTTNSIPHDVNFTILTERPTAGRVRALYPVHPRCLDRYICTLSPHIMKKMEMEIVKLLCPTIYAECMNGAIDFFDNTQSLYEKVATRITLANVRSVLESFIKEKIRNTGLATDVLDVITLKTSFDEFCLSNGYEIMTDHLEFLGYFQENCADGPKPLTELMEIRGYPGMVIREQVCAKQEISEAPRTSINTTLAPPSSQNTLTSTSAKKWNKWTDEKVEEFLEYYRKFGVEETSKIYNIEASTAKIYFTRWDGKNEEKNDVVERESDVTLEKSNLPNVIHAPNAISKISNIIKDVMHEEDVFMYVHSHLKGKQKIFAETFYKRLQTCIYTSLFDFLQIKKITNSKFDIPDVTEESKYLSTWKFLDIIYNNSSLSYRKDGKGFMKKFREEFDATLGIDKDWVTFLSPKLLKMLNLTKGGSEHISQLLEKEFCGITETK